MVIITAGIDLSVGSMIALSAVVAASLIEKMGGAAEAGTSVFLIASLAVYWPAPSQVHSQVLWSVSFQFLPLLRTCHDASSKRDRF